MPERVGHIVERRLQRVGRVYPLELKAGRRGGEGEVKDPE